MAITALLTQNNVALAGTPINFTLAITNPDAQAINITGIQPVVTTAAGQLGIPVYIGGPYASPNQSVASTTTSQFNVQIPGTTTAYFAFNVTIMAPAVIGSSAIGLNQYLVGANIIDSGGTVTAAASIELALNAPTFGPAPGSPPNPAVDLGSLVFTLPGNSALAL